MRENVVGRVPSLSDPKVLYPITAWQPKGGAEELRCACQAFASWKKRGLPCWHLRVWDAAQKALARCYERHGGDGGDGQALCAPCLLQLLAAAASKVKNDYIPRPPKKVRVPKEKVCTCTHGDSLHLLAATTQGLSCCTAKDCDCRMFTVKPKRVRRKPRTDSEGALLCSFQWPDRALCHRRDGHTGPHERGAHPDFAPRGRKK